MSNRWVIAEQREVAYEGPRVYVSLNRRGEIAMNAEAFRLIGEPCNVTLLFDTEKRYLGVKCPVALDRHFYPVRDYGRGRRMRVVRAARMLRQAGLEIAETVVFMNIEVIYVGGQATLLLDLEQLRCGLYRFGDGLWTRGGVPERLKYADQPAELGPPVRDVVNEFEQHGASGGV